MGREFFMETERVGFSRWREDDLALATLLWGDPAVTRLICASGRFEPREIEGRLKTEISNDNTHKIQYWPVFERTAEDLIGCCGLRPRDERTCELGFHLRPAFWGKGYAREMGTAVIQYAFKVLGTEQLFAGHHPDNIASKKVLEALGFVFLGREFYAPTGLEHPSYTLRNPG